MSYYIFTDLIFQFQKIFPLTFRLVEVMETCQDSYDYIFYIETREIMLFTTQVFKVVIRSNATNLDLGLHTKNN
jgi:hypothetical protein